MMRLIVNNKKPKGLCFNNARYGGIPGAVSIQTTKRLSIPTKIHTSIGTEYSSGYPVTFSFDTSQFKLFDLNYEQFFELPKHKFVLYDGNENNVTTIQLIYDGDGLFHLEGDLSGIKSYVSGKYDAVTTKLALVAENNTLFISDVSIFSTTVGTTSTTVNFTTPSNTIERSYIAGESSLTKIELPFVVDNLPTIDSSADFPTGFVSTANSVAPTVTDSHTLL